MVVMALATTTTTTTSTKRDTRCTLHSILLVALFYPFQRSHAPTNSPVCHSSSIATCLPLACVPANGKFVYLQRMILFNMRSFYALLFHSFTSWFLPLLPAVASCLRCCCVLYISFTHILSLHFVHFQPNNHNNFLSTSQFHGVYERHAEWENIVIPQMHQYNQQIHPYQHMTNNHNSRHRMSYLIKSLAPSSNYEARVQARNDHGWNKLSSTFHFSTRAEGKIASTW